MIIAGGFKKKIPVSGKTQLTAVSELPSIDHVATAWQDIANKVSIFQISGAVLSKEITTDSNYFDDIDLISGTNLVIGCPGSSGTQKIEVADSGLPTGSASSLQQTGSGDMMRIQENKGTNFVLISLNSADKINIYDRTALTLQNQNSLNQAEALAVKQNGQQKAVAGTMKASSRDQHVIDYSDGSTILVISTSAKKMKAAEYFVSSDYVMFMSTQDKIEICLDTSTSSGV